MNISACFLPACTSVYHVHAWCPQRSAEGAASPGTAAIDGCELPCGCREKNPGPLQERQKYS